jgi:hypothetical protein
MPTENIILLIILTAFSTYLIVDQVIWLKTVYQSIKKEKEDETSKH